MDRPSLVVERNGLIFEDSLSLSRVTGIPDAHSGVPLSKTVGDGSVSPPRDVLYHQSSAVREKSSHVQGSLF